MTTTFTPRPGAAPLPRQVLAQARMETRLLLRNGEQLLLALVIPLLVLFGVLMSLEPAVAALAGYVVLGQDLSAREVMAILLVVTASAGVTRAAATAPRDA